MPKQSVSGIHSQWELDLTRRFNQTKDNIVSPLITLLQLIHVKPSHLSFAGIITLLITLFLSLLFTQPLFFIFGFCFHLIFDGLDGSLARRKKISPHEELTDIIADHTGIILTSFMIIFFHYAPTTITIIYSTLYTLVIALALIRNKLNIPFRFIFRPRLYIYLAFAIDYFFNLQLTHYVLLLSSFLLLLPTITGTVILLRLKQLL